MIKIRLLIPLLFISTIVLGQAQTPCYKIRLKSEQYPIFSQSVFNGIHEKGGKLDYSVEILKERTGIFVNISICDRVLAEQVKSELSQEVVDVLSQIESLDRIEPTTKWKLNALKAINQKIDYALKNPSRPEVNLKGTIQSNNGVMILATIKDGTSLLTSRMQNRLSPFEGQQVVVHGLRNEDNSIEVQSILPVKENTLELFIMSQCPFGLQAAERLIDFKNRTGAQSPELDIRYIFYQKPTGFESMHGEEELVENLVHMLIRDRHGNVFFDYLTKRIDDKTANWQNLAAAAGLSKKEINSLETALKTDREVLIRQEYDYVNNKNRIADGSPSYVWQGEQINNLELIEAFKDINLQLSGDCAN